MKGTAAYCVLGHGPARKGPWSKCSGPLLLPLTHVLRTASRLEALHGQCPVRYSDFISLYCNFTLPPLFVIRLQTMLGLGDGSAGQVLVGKAQGPEFESLGPMSS